MDTSSSHSHSHSHSHDHSHDHDHDPSSLFPTPTTENSGGSNPNAHTYTSPHPIYAMAFSPSPSPSPSTFLAIGSFLEDLSNRVDLLSFDEDSLSFLPPDASLSFDHPYPPTKLLFSPSPPHTVLASSGDYLRLWQIDHSNNVKGGGVVRLLSLLDNSKSTEYCAPLTSFDWNPSDPRLLATSSIDTTCTVWDVERSAVEMQLIAHDKEVYDVAWGESRVFASVSADASVRVFDLRNKEHSTIIYEADAPLLRLVWNRNDLRYMAAVAMDSPRVAILDIRSPGAPIAELQRHRGSVNAVAWAPHTARHLCSAGDDGEALIWQLPPVVSVSPPASAGAPEGGIDPILAYSAGSEINQLQWSAVRPEWIGIAFSNKLQLLRV